MVSHPPRSPYHPPLRHLQYTLSHTQLCSLILTSISELLYTLKRPGASRTEADYYTNHSPAQAPLITYVCLHDYLAQQSRPGRQSHSGWTHSGRERIKIGMDNEAKRDGLYFQARTPHNLQGPTMFVSSSWVTASLAYMYLLATQPAE